MCTGVTHGRGMYKKGLDVVLFINYIIFNIVLFLIIPVGSQFQHHHYHLANQLKFGQHHRNGVCT